MEAGTARPAAGRRRAQAHHGIASGLASPRMADRRDPAHAWQQGAQHDLTWHVCRGA